MSNSPHHAVRVVLRDDNNQTFSRDYVRGDKHLGKQAFTEWAVGNFIGLVTEHKYNGIRVVSVEEIDYNTVIQNRKYHHTTH